jgi:hypothetical protein
MERDDRLDWTDEEAEGVPELEEQPPGVDAEIAVEGTFPPRDQPLVASGFGTTERDQQLGESLEQRVAQEIAEPGAGPEQLAWVPVDEGPGLDVADTSSDYGEETEGRDLVEAPGATAEEQAMHIIEP